MLSLSSERFLTIDVTVFLPIILISNTNALVLLFSLLVNANTE